MATGALDANGVWHYGEDDSEATFSALLNKLGGSVSSSMKGRIAQVVSATYSVGVTNATSTYVSTGLSLSITPKYATSKIIVQTSINGLGKDAGGNSEVSINLNKNGTSVQAIEGAATFTNTTAANFVGGVSSIYVETATTTAARTFNPVFRNDSASGLARVQADNCTSSMIIWEITQ